MNGVFYCYSDRGLSEYFFFSKSAWNTSFLSLFLICECFLFLFWAVLKQLYTVKVKYPGAKYPHCTIRSSCLYQQCSFDYNYFNIQNKRPEVPVDVIQRENEMNKSNANQKSELLFSELQVCGCWFCKVVDVLRATSRWPWDNI